MLKKWKPEFAEKIVEVFLNQKVGSVLTCLERPEAWSLAAGHVVDVLMKSGGISADAQATNSNGDSSSCA